MGDRSMQVWLCILSRPLQTKILKSPKLAWFEIENPDRWRIISIFIWNQTLSAHILCWSWGLVPLETVITSTHSLNFYEKFLFFTDVFDSGRCLPELYFIKARREGDQMQPFLVRAFRKNCKNNCLYQLVSEIEIFVNENHVNWILLYWLCDWQWSPAKKQVALTITLVHLSKRLRKLFILAFT